MAQPEAAAQQPAGAESDNASRIATELAGMSLDSIEQSGQSKPYETLFRLGLQAYYIHFSTPDYMLPNYLAAWDQKVLKTTLSKSAKCLATRTDLGASKHLWKAISETLDAASVDFQRRCFAIIVDANDLESEAPSGLLISTHSVSLVADIKRVYDILAIARNIISTGERAQGLCASTKTDQTVLRLISLAVRICARGYDGEAGKPEEARWRDVNNEFKRLIVVALQLLNNFTTQNECRKLMLWAELFDRTTDDDVLFADVSDDDPIDVIEQSLAPGFVEKMLQCKPETLSINSRWDVRTGTTFLLFLGNHTKDVQAALLTELGREPTPKEVVDYCTELWIQLSDMEKLSWSWSYHDLCRKHLTAKRYIIADLGDSFDPSKYPEPTLKTLALLSQQKIGELQLAFPADLLSPPKKPSQPPQPAPPAVPEDLSSAIPKPQGVTQELFSALEDYARIWDPFSESQNDEGPIQEADCTISYSPDYGTSILQRAKDDLMQRLQAGYSMAAPPQYTAPPEANYPPRNGESLPFPEGYPVEEIENEEARRKAEAHMDGSAVPIERADDGLPKREYTESETEDDDLDDEDGEEEDEEEDEDDEDDEEDDEDEYIVPGDVQRGLLTDIPLFLGPSEIEVLPLLILSGIMAPVDEGKGEMTSKMRNLYTLRCHILLARDNGRNLLRELLIYIAAWDLREEDLYYKFMAKIVERILANGVMCLLYNSFTESKDILSPAQTVIMKLLTHIIRTRHTKPYDQYDIPYPSRIHQNVITFLLSEFRRHIIPQVCSLIFLQGQIRAGHAGPDEFPLNNWEMERTYEGLYQFLEFFAILTEQDIWKDMMTKWEIMSELIHLLRELDTAIPMKSMKDAYPSPTRPASPVSVTDPKEQNNMVERPYDVLDLSADSRRARYGNQGEYSPSFSQAQYNTDANNVNYPAQPDAADFEWKNLKKLAILVISSLVWKNQAAQDQVRKFQGIETLINCCTQDEHNPFMREHAIMCLRFLLENNSQNQALVRSLGGNSVATATGTSHHVPSSHPASESAEPGDVSGADVDAEGDAGPAPAESAQTGASADEVPTEGDQTSTDNFVYSCCCPPRAKTEGDEPEEEPEEPEELEEEEEEEPGDPSAESLRKTLESSLDMLSTPAFRRLKAMRDEGKPISANYG